MRIDVREGVPVTIRGKAFIVGAYEHPDRVIPDKTVSQIHAEVALGAVEDAGLTLDDVDGYFCSPETPGLRNITMAEYLGLNLRYLDTSEVGGASYIAHVGHAAAAIAEGKCSVALVTLAGAPRSVQFGGLVGTNLSGEEVPFEFPYGSSTLAASYAIVAQRHMYEFGTTSAQLAEIKVAASLHAQFNPHAFMPHPVTVEQVLDSPMIADPLHRLDSCVITDGGGALVVVSPEVAKSLKRRSVMVLGQGEGVKHTDNGRLDLTYSAAVQSGPIAFGEAGVTPADIDYVSIYDSFTITVLVAIEDLGFCEKGKGGAFVSDGAIVAPHGILPFNTDGGGLCSNHPSNRGGMTKVIEAVRQLRGEANPEVQLPNCQLALAHGTGGWLGTRHGCATLILGQEDG
jgi:acetyl-CoA C-acetyltransferase